MVVFFSRRVPGGREPSFLLWFTYCNTVPAINLRRMKTPSVVPKYLGSDYNITYFPKLLMSETQLLDVINIAGPCMCRSCNQTRSVCALIQTASGVPNKRGPSPTSVHALFYQSDGRDGCHSPLHTRCGTFQYIFDDLAACMT